MDYEIKYARRKNVTIRVRDCKISVVAPEGTDERLIEELVHKHRRWIEKRIDSQRARTEALSDMSEGDIRALKSEARIYFTALVERYAALMGAEYNKIRITSAKTRHGSCTREKNISFSYRLMLYPESAREYVVVHELAHTLQMNHSKKFYSIVESVLPDYKERKRLLK